MPVCIWSIHFFLLFYASLSTVYRMLWILFFIRSSVWFYLLFTATSTILSMSNWFLKGRNCCSASLYMGTMLMNYYSVERHLPVDQTNLLLSIIDITFYQRRTIGNAKDMNTFVVCISPRIDKYCLLSSHLVKDSNENIH